MSYQVIQRFGIRTLLVGLFVFVGVIGAFVSMHRIGAHADGTTFSTSFKETVGNDVYTFTNKSPASGTAASANLGTWDVTDNGTDLGTIGEQVGTSSSGSNITGSISFTGTGSFSSLNGLSSKNTTFPTDTNYTTNSIYKNYVAKGAYVTSISNESVMGDEFMNMNCPDVSNCANLAIDTQSVTDLGVYDSAVTAMNNGLQDQDNGYNELQALSASTTPSQMLARRDGGGPLAIMKSQIPAIAPLAVFLIGVAVSAVGAVVGNFCSHAKGCLGLSKNTWSAIGAVIGVVGGTLMGAAFAPGLFATAAATATAAGEVAAGAAETAAVEAVGSSLSAASVASIESVDSFMTAASTFSAA